MLSSASIETAKRLLQSLKIEEFCQGKQDKEEDEVLLMSIANGHHGPNGFLVKHERILEWSNLVTCYTLLEHLYVHWIRKMTEDETSMGGKVGGNLI